MLYNIKLLFKIVNRILENIFEDLIDKNIYYLFSYLEI